MLNNFILLFLVIIYFIPYVFKEKKYLQENLSAECNKNCNISFDCHRDQVSDWENDCPGDWGCCRKYGYVKLCPNENLTAALERIKRCDAERRAAAEAAERAQEQLRLNRLYRQQAADRAAAAAARKKQEEAAAAARRRQEEAAATARRNAQQAQRAQIEYALVEEELAREKQERVDRLTSLVESASTLDELNSLKNSYNDVSGEINNLIEQKRNEIRNNQSANIKNKIGTISSIEKLNELLSKNEDADENSKELITNKIIDINREINIFKNVIKNGSIYNIEYALKYSKNIPTLLKNEAKAQLKVLKNIRKQKVIALVKKKWVNDVKKTF